MNNDDIAYIKTVDYAVCRSVRVCLLHLLSIVMLLGPFSQAHAQNVTEINITNITINEAMVEGLSTLGDVVGGTFSTISDYAPVLDVLGLLSQSTGDEDSFKESAPQLFSELHQISSNIQALHTSLSSLEESVASLALNGPLLRVSGVAYTLEKQTLGLLSDALKSECRAVPGSRMINLNDQLDKLTHSVDWAANYAGDAARGIVVSYTLVQVAMKMELARVHCHEQYTSSENEYLSEVLIRVRGELLSRTEQYVAGYPYLAPDARKDAMSIVARATEQMESKGVEALFDCVARTYKYEDEEYPLARGVAECREITVVFSTKRRPFSKKYKCSITEYSGYRIPLRTHTVKSMRKIASTSSIPIISPAVAVAISKNGEQLTEKEKQLCSISEKPVNIQDELFKKAAQKRYTSLSRAAKVVVDAQANEQANRIGLLTIGLLNEIEKRI